MGMATRSRRLHLFGQGFPPPISWACWTRQSGRRSYTRLVLWVSFRDTRLDRDSCTRRFDVVSVGRSWFATPAPSSSTRFVCALWLRPSCPCAGVQVSGVRLGFAEGPDRRWRARFTSSRPDVGPAAIRGLIVSFLLTNAGLSSRERESLRDTFRGTERNPTGCARTPNVAATNREHRPPCQNRRNPLRATSYRDHAARPRCGVAVNELRPSLSRKPVDLRE
jgi:hypothetical protein